MKYNNTILKIIRYSILLVCVESLAVNCWANVSSCPRKCLLFVHEDLGNRPHGYPVPNEGGSPTFSLFSGIFSTPENRNSYEPLLSD